MNNKLVKIMNETVKERKKVESMKCFSLFEMQNE